MGFAFLIRVGVVVEIVVGRLFFGVGIGVVGRGRGGGFGGYIWEV